MECVTEMDPNELCISGDVARSLLNKYLLSTPLSIKFIKPLSLQGCITDELLVKYLAPEERVQYEISKSPLCYLAKRISAKMAFMEIYSGEAKLLYNQIKIDNDEKGCPHFYMEEARIPGYALSLSDEANMIAVFCCVTTSV